MTNANLINKRLLFQLNNKLRSTLENYIGKPINKQTKSEISDRVMSILTDLIPEENWNDIQYSATVKGNQMIISPKNEFTKHLLEKINNEVFTIS